MPAGGLKALLSAGSLQAEEAKALLVHLPKASAQIAPRLVFELRVTEGNGGILRSIAIYRPLSADGVAAPMTYDLADVLLSIMRLLATDHDQFAAVCPAPLAID